MPAESSSAALEGADEEAGGGRQAPLARVTRASTEGNTPGSPWVGAIRAAIRYSMARASRLSRRGPRMATMLVGDDTTELAFINCSYTIQVTKAGKPLPPLAKLRGIERKERKLVDNVSANVPGGRVLAVITLGCLFSFFPSAVWCTPSERGGVCPSGCCPNPTRG